MTQDCKFFTSTYVKATFFNIFNSSREQVNSNKCHEILKNAGLLIINGQVTLIFIIKVLESLLFFTTFLYV